MQNFTIFKRENAELFTEYGYGVSTINHILHSIGYDLTTIFSIKAREDGIRVISELLKYDIVKITFIDGKYIEKEKASIKDGISTIEKLWTKDISDVEGFEKIVRFEYQDWYSEKISDLKINEKSKWRWFKNDFVPNMKHWIKENRPK